MKFKFIFSDVIMIESKSLTADSTFSTSNNNNVGRFHYRSFDNSDQNNHAPFKI